MSVVKGDKIIKRNLEIGGVLSILGNAKIRWNAGLSSLDFTDSGDIVKMRLVITTGDLSVAGTLSEGVIF